MKIGIDIDDTLTNTKEIFARKIKEYCRKNKIALTANHPLTPEEFHAFLASEGKEIYTQMKLKKNAAQTIRTWNEQGHKIYFITARSKKDFDSSIDVTKEFLKKHNIPYVRLIHDSKNKYKDSQKLNLDIFIDDRETVLDTFPKEKTQLIRFIANKNHYSKYLKVQSWKELKKIIDTL